MESDTFIHKSLLFHTSNSSTSTASSSGDVPFQVALLLISVPLIFLTVIGNSLVILVWITTPKTRSPSSTYLLSLAVADLITGILIFPPTIHYSYTNDWTYGLPFCRFFLVVLFSMYTVTAFHLVAIALDRQNILMDGLSYLQRRTYKSVCEKLLIIWGLGFWVSIPLILDWENVSRYPYNERSCITRKIPYWTAHYFGTSFWFPAIALVRIYSNVYLEIRKRLRAKTVKEARKDIQGVSCSKEGTGEKEDVLSDENPYESTEESSISTRVYIGNTAKATKERRSKQLLLRERKTALTVVVISGAFILCGLPWNLLSLADAMSPDYKPLPRLSFFSFIAVLANSCINPIVYATRMPEFRKAVKKMFRLS